MLKGPPDEVGNHIAVSPRDFPGTINIKIATDDYGKSIIVVEEVAVKLAKKLCYLIGSVKVKGDKVLLEGKWCLTAINRTARRSKDEFAYFV
ncbi:hypothetical protein ES703_93524 [subsurface metagenome]